MAPKDKSASPDWECRKCFGRDGGHFRNNGSKKTCHKCGVTKGACFHANITPKWPSTRGGTGQDKKLQDLDATIKKQADEIARLKGASQGGADSAEVDGGAEDQDAKASLDKAIVSLRKMVAETKAIPAKYAVPGRLVEYEQKLAAATKEREEARPPNARLTSAKQNLSNKERALDKAKATKTAAEKALEEAQEGLAKATESVVSDTEAVAAAKEELSKATELVNGKAVPEIDSAEALLKRLGEFGNFGEHLVAGCNPSKAQALEQALRFVHECANETAVRNGAPAAGTKGGTPAAVQPQGQLAPAAVPGAAAEAATATAGQTTLDHAAAVVEQPAAESDDVVFNGLDVKGFEELLSDESDGEEDAATLKAKNRALKAKGKEQMAAIQAHKKSAKPQGVKKIGGK